MYAFSWFILWVLVGLAYFLKGMMFIDSTWLLILRQASEVCSPDNDRGQIDSVSTQSLMRSGVRMGTLTHLPILLIKSLTSPVLFQRVDSADTASQVAKCTEAERHETLEPSCYLPTATSYLQARYLQLLTRSIKIVPNVILTEFKKIFKLY